MKIVIPMAGVGQRFKDEGYSDPKPLIRLGDGRMIIEHVLDMFDRTADEFVFVVNATHAAQHNIDKLLPRLVKRSVVRVMDDHKLGPVHTVKKAFGDLRDDEPVIVAYCDGKVEWDYSAFKKYVYTSQTDGCLITHTGFHPHTLSTTKMAFVKETEGRVEAVQEKQCFTDDPFSEHASSGVYYFRRASDLTHYSKEYLYSGDSFNGEYYVTLLYNFMIASGLRVRFYDTEFVAILGTPHEVELFNAWWKIAGDLFTNMDNVATCYNYWKNYRTTDENRQNTIFPERPS